MLISIILVFCLSFSVLMSVLIWFIVCPYQFIFVLIFMFSFRFEFSRAPLVQSRSSSLLRPSLLFSLISSVPFVSRPTKQRPHAFVFGTEPAFPARAHTTILTSQRTDLCLKLANIWGYFRLFYELLDSSKRLWSLLFDTFGSARQRYYLVLRDFMRILCVFLCVFQSYFLIFCRLCLTKQLYLFASISYKLSFSVLLPVFTGFANWMSNTKTHLYKKTLYLIEDQQRVKNCAKTHDRKARVSGHQKYPTRMTRYSENFYPRLPALWFFSPCLRP